MPLYEHVFLARQDLTTAQIDAMTKKLTELIEAGKGKVSKTESWGLRSLAYKIKKNRKAHYVMMNVKASAQVISELERMERLDEDILRFLTIRVKEHESEPSAMMRRDRERSERPDSRHGGSRKPTRASAA